MSRWYYGGDTLDRELRERLLHEGDAADVHELIQRWAPLHTAA